MHEIHTDHAATAKANGRCFDNMNRGQNDGILGPHPLSPTAGAHYNSIPHVNLERDEDERREGRRDGRGAPKPKMNFPKFHGDDPKIWVRQCEDHFSLYDIQEVFKTALLL